MPSSFRVELDPTQRLRHTEAVELGAWRAPIRTCSTTLRGSARGSVDGFSKEVGVAVVASGFFDHVEKDPSQTDGAAGLPIGFGCKGIE